jgi:molybdopterin converting factor small subunit
MIQVVVRIPDALRPFADEAHEVNADAGTLAEVLEELGERHPQLAQRIVTPEGKLRPFVNIFVGRGNIRALQGMATPVPPGAVVSILPAVSGG